jgi:hypothetical protein
MKKFLLLLILLIPTLVLAADPSITRVDYNQPYLNKPVTFTIHINPDDTNAVLRFVDNGYLITQQLFTPETTSIDFTYTWNVTETRELKFYITNIEDATGNDTNNDEVIKTITIKRGLDLIIENLSMDPSVFTPEQQTKFTYTIKNIGDENYSGLVKTEILIDSNSVCSVDVNLSSPNAECLWTPPASNATSYNVVAWVNRNNAVPELTLTNNTTSISIGTIARPDLIVDKINISQQIRRGEVTNIAVLIKNLSPVRVENTTLDIYLTHKGATYNIYATDTGEIFGRSSKGINYAYLFADVGDYTIKAVIDANNSLVESIESNNEFSYRITVVDFNMQQVLEENTRLRTDLAAAEGKLQGTLAELDSYKQDVLNKETQLKNTQTNLEICNTNNSSKISNWMKDYDANSTAVFQAQYNSLLQAKKDSEDKCNTNLQIVGEEKNQWAGIVILGLLSFAIWIIYNEYLKKMPRKNVGNNGGF